MRDAFESWMGQEVVVQLGFGLIKVRLRGVLLQDLRETLLLKPEAGPSIEIPKIRVLAIEEVGRSPNGLLRYVLHRSSHSAQRILPGIHSIKVLVMSKENTRRQVL